jgi:hypothetical protein
VTTGGPQEIFQVVFSQLAGRCANGFQRDAGSRVHAIAKKDWHEGAGPHLETALCGTEPGRLSAGWGDLWKQDQWDVDSARTCPRCARKVHKLGL